MSRLQTCLLATITIALWSTASTPAGSRFLCGNELIREGDSMHEIRLDCGDPASEMHVGEKIIFSDPHSEEVRYVTEWVYDRGAFVYILVFEGSILEKTIAKRR